MISFSQNGVAATIQKSAKLARAIGTSNLEREDTKRDGFRFNGRRSNAVPSRQQKQRQHQPRGDVSIKIGEEESRDRSPAVGQVNSELLLDFQECASHPQWSRPVFCLRSRYFICPDVYMMSTGIIDHFGMLSTWMLLCAAIT